ncbi:hypothetical protein D8S78_22920 [Natrialba swarupiae]|nr:hypothetical protein [Natrialba swarupiae]
MVEGQLEGAVLHGVEFAICSELRADNGIPENSSLADYSVASPVEMPNQLECEIIESAERSGPYGAKGSGHRRYHRLHPQSETRFVMQSETESRIRQRPQNACFRDGRARFRRGGASR